MRDAQSKRLPRQDPTRRTDRPDGPAIVGRLVRAPSLSDRVVQELQSLIVTNQVRPGQLLPSERDLAEQFDVSRTVIREALRALAAKGLVDISNGRGTVVLTMTPMSAAASMKLLMQMQPGGMDLANVIEVRRLLEVEIAGVSAERRSTDDLSALTASLAAAERHLGVPDTFVDHDIEFHMGLAVATRNELYPLILDSLSIVLTEVRLVALRIPGTPERALAHHRAIYTAVEAGRPREARAAMNAHMDEAQETLERGAVSEADPS